MMMGERIDLGDVMIDVVRKDIKNLHLRVHPPDGKVRISAPLRTDPAVLRAFAASKLDWIRRQRRKIGGTTPEPRLGFVGGESHRVWGVPHLLKVTECGGAPSVELAHGALLLHVRPGTDAGKRRELVEFWYRSQVREAVLPLLALWEPRIGVEAKRVHVRRMKTKWGSCNRRAGSIRLNTELAKKPRECLEYVVIHELVHLLEPTHGPRFRSLMDGFMPQWKERRQVLNRLPVREEGDREA